MIEVGSYWKFNMGGYIIIVIGNTIIREATNDVPGVTIECMGDLTGEKIQIQIPVSSLLRFYTQLTPLEMELL